MTQEEFINNIIDEYNETREDFIFKTIYPYCTEVIERTVSKAELKRLITKGLRYDEIAEEANKLTEQNIRLTKRNNELRGKVLRLIHEKEKLSKTLDTHMHNIATMEYKLNKIKEVLQEVDNE